MRQIADWLEKLGLGQYARRFNENGIDLSVLPDLTDQDLEKLGVLLGHRRKLLRAIADLKDVEKSTPADAIATVAHAVPHPLDSAERRQVTVMFSDLVGSTELAARMDPEDLRDLISSYQGCVTQTVRRFGGFVAKYMGDGVLVYFGYPQAHEDDAEQAVRAGLDLVAAVASLKTHTALQTRVGIATGLVVVGDLIGSGSSQEEAIVGETPNLAARLQGIAQPNTVVIADSTRRLLGNLFELQDLGPTDLKGIAGPVPAWAALRASSVGSRFEALHTTGLIALVGREEESQLLHRRWSRAKSGEGQVVLLSGEAGIGKSRLTAALLEKLATEPHTRLRYFCSPQHTDSALYPIIGQMERAAGLAHDDKLQARLDKLDAVLAQTSTSTQDAALFAEMLSLPNDGRYPALELTPQQRRQKTLEALISQLEALTRWNPVLMIFEDAHWTDPTSLEVFGRVVDGIAILPVLLIVTFRPEFDPPWIGQPHVTALTINRLTQRDVDAMIDRVVGNKQLPASIRREIVERTDGIPLFVEEMTKAVLEAESEGAARRLVAAVPSSALAVPASLHASLMARLDRIGPAKEVAQIGAAIGREFSHALLASVARKPEAELGSAIGRLIQAGLLFRQGVPPHATYLFKHALEKDAGLWGKAGQRTLERSALVEATEQLTRALNQIATLPSTPALRREEIRLRVTIITPLLHVKGYASPEAKTAAERARYLIEQAETLGEPSDDPLLLFSVLYGFWAANFVAFSGDAVRELATQFLALAEKQRATLPLTIGHRLMGTSLTCVGAFAESRAHYDQAISLYDPAEHRPLATRFGQDVGVITFWWRSLALWALGYPESALADTERALKNARDIGQAATLMYALAVTPITHTYCGNYSTANAILDELLTLADEKGTLYWKALGMMNKGWLLITTRNTADAAQMITAGISLWRATGATLFTPGHLSSLAKAYAELGQFEEAWRCIGEAMRAAETTKEKWCEAEIHRTAGEITLISPVPDASKAQADFERALAIARAQQAKSWELRAATSLARLWRDQG